MYASHTLLAYPIASRLGIARNEAVVVTIGGTLVTNTISLSILAVIASSAQGTLNAMFWIGLVVSFAVFCLAIFVLLPRLARWFFCNVESEGILQFMFILALVFGSASIAHLAGIEPVIGAFIAGLSISRLVPSGSALLNRINFVGNALFIPFFLIYVGMLVDLRVLFGGFDALIVAATMTVTATGTKWLAALTAQKFFRYSATQRNVIFGLSNAQAANTLAAVMIGYQLGLLNENVLNGTIVMIFVTCITSSLVVDRAGAKLAIEQTGHERNEGPLNNQRILVPISNLKSIERLIDFSCNIKNPALAYPICSLTVITDTADARKHIAEAERLLLKAQSLATGSETAIKLITRIDVNAISGILTVIREMGITSIVLGWSGESSAKEYFFGSLHEHLLDQSTQTVFVNGIRSPLNTIKRINVILSPFSEFELGLHECLADLHRLSRNLKVPIRYQGLSGAINAVRRYCEDLAVPLDTTAFTTYDTWEDMPTRCRQETKPYDINVFVTSRRGGLSWNAEMERYAKKMQRTVENSNNVLLYLSIKEALVASDVKCFEQI